MAETWNMGHSRGQKIECNGDEVLRSMCGVTCMDQVRDEVVQRRTEIVKELAGQTTVAMFWAWGSNGKRTLGEDDNKI